MTQKQISLKDVVNVGPVEKRNGSKNWKSVYHLLSGVAAEYIVNVLKPETDGEVYGELKQLFEDAIKSPKDWYAKLSEYDSMDELLDALDFQENDASYANLVESLTFVLDDGGSSMALGNLSFPFSQRYLKLKEFDGSIYALAYSETSQKPLFTAISGPGEKINYSEDAPIALKHTTGVQIDPSHSAVHTVDAGKFFNLTEDLANVDKDQRAAISADMDRNLLVVAGAGSGKTRSLVGRMCYLHLVKGVPLSRIVMLTYMKKATHPLMKSASDQLSEAYVKMSVPPSSDNINVSTIDAFFKKIVDTYWAEIGFIRKPEYRFDMEDRKLDVLKNVVKDNNYPLHKEMSIPELKRQLENYANGLTVNIPGIDNILRSYVDWQVENHEILEFFCVSCIVKRALEDESTGLKDKICESYDCILIDEFQDINKLQNEIFSMLYDTNIHFTLVGDDDQTIYTWRGSDVGIIRDMQKDETVRTVYLTVNYRNNPHIVEAGNAVLKDMGDRSKNGMEITPYQTTGPLIRIAPVTAQYKDLANEVRKMYDPSPDADRICILSRNKENQELIQKALKDHDIPSVITKNVADNDISPGYRILKALTFIFSRYNVKANYDTLNELTSGRYTNMELKSFITGLKPFTDREPEEAVKVADIVSLSEYVDVKLHQAFTFEEMVSNYCRAYSEIVEKNAAVDRSVLDPCLASFQDYVSRNDWPYPEIAKDVLTSIFSRFEKIFLSNKSTYDSNMGNVNTVTISTIHSSKGLEYDTVFVVGLDDGAFPNTKKIDRDYIACVNEIQNLGASKRSLDRLRASIGTHTVEQIIEECNPSRFDPGLSEKFEGMREELEDIGSDLAVLNGQGVGDYLLAYDDFIRPMVDTYKGNLRILSLEKHSIQERYYKCEDTALSEETVSEASKAEMESIRKEIEEKDAQISKARSELDVFMEKIRLLTFMNGICNTVSQYFLDIDHLEHESQLKSSLAKEREEKIYEEKRSFYVAISRARKLLYLCPSFGERPSPFIGIIDPKDTEPYRMTTKYEDDQAETIRKFKSLFKEEMDKRRPDLKRIDDATAQMMNVASDNLKSRCEANAKKFLVEHPAFRELSGDAQRFFRTALDLDLIGKDMGADFNNEVLLNLQRSGEEIIKGHVTKDAIQMVADEATCTDINAKLYDVISDCRVKRTPTVAYLQRLLNAEDQYHEVLTKFKGISLGQYITFSKNWPEMTAMYSDNWDVSELKIDPDEFIVAALDLCNIRNQVTHENTDEPWKTDQVPYAIVCLKKIINAY